MKATRDYGLDILKAISIVLVISWHFKPLEIIPGTDINIISKIFRNLIHIFYFQICLTAVPIFIIISLYLFFSKTNSDYGYLKKRIFHLIKIFFFWSVIQFIVATVALGRLPSLSGDLVLGMFLGRKPELPMAYDSILYYLAVLIILTIIAFYYKNLSEKPKQILSSAIIIISLLYFEISGLAGFAPPYWRLDNFIIYIPIAFLLATDKEKLLKYKYYYLAVYLLLSIHDLYLRYTGYELGVYSRVGIVFGALALFSLIYPLKIRENWYINQLAKYSLGLYTLHRYWQYLFLVLILKSDLSEIGILGVKLNMVSLTVSLMALIFTFLSIYLLRLTPLKIFIA